MEVLFTLLFLLGLSTVQSARILIVFPLPERSHYILASSLAKALAEKGHDITMVSPFVEANPPTSSYREVQLTGAFEDIQEKQSKNELNFFTIEGPNPFLNAVRLAMTSDEVESVFKHPNFQKLIKSKETFDVVIVEQFLNDALHALATHFKAPLIIFSSLGANFWVNTLTGNPAPTAYVPDTLLKFSEKMTFVERLVNTCTYILNELVYKLYVYPRQSDIVKKYLPGGPHIDDVIYNASIIFLNSHPSTSQAVPHVPNMIEIGGIHVQTPKALPQHLQTILDDAKKGVIYFSMGSNAKSSQFPKEKLEAFLKAFSKLEETVLWKWEDDILPELPTNVKTGKWLPQQDILAHPNVKLFITHGGLLSTTEAVYHGVPVLAIPIFGDQTINAKLAENNVYGLVLPYEEISEQSLQNKIQEILKNPRYKTNAKRRSKIFHDRHVGPKETAIYWVEYVIRHKGAPHLRVAGVDMPWYQYFLLDIVIFILVLKSKPQKIKTN
ncbi:hypothetical protein Zmor_025270 [Zophobas morio]|uniref:UDP-glucuronosyltransferase n=1 Tax=Zophobas morio TaxID=2755281 RepID=A0AA38HRQ0_9CUCU|nr:hypothetical protein Zmor_025270 [Zophobas morio]